MSSKQQLEQPNIRTDNINDLINELDSEELTTLLYATETAERYDDMRLLCKTLVPMLSKQGKELDVAQRNLLSVAYKNAVGVRRASWRSLNGRIDDIDTDIIHKYQTIVKNELENICLEILDLLITHLCKTIENKNNIHSNTETQTYYFKMTGDYYRYLSELYVANNIKNYDKLSEKYYMKAVIIAEQYLEADHPTRLHLMLCFSVCCYEILKQPQRAIDVSKKAFDCAIDCMKTAVVEYAYKDSTLMMQLIRENQIKWVKEKLRKRATHIVNGYITEMKSKYSENELIIPDEINQIVINYYVESDQDLSKLL